MRPRPPADPPPIPPDLRQVDAGAGPLEDESTIAHAHVHGLRAEAAARHLVLDASRLTASLPGARLGDLDVRGSEVLGGDLANADLSGARLQKVTVRDTRLTGARLTGASLTDVVLSGCRLDLAVLAEARLDRVALLDCDLTEAVLDEAILRDVVLERCRLMGTSLHRVRLQRVELLGCELDGVRSIADLRGAAMPWPDIVANAAALAAAVGVGVLGD